MFQEFEIREIPLSIKSMRNKISCFLEENDLSIDQLDYYAGIFHGEKMLAGGGFLGDVMKCIAVLPEVRELNLSNKLISHLHAVGYSRGYQNIFVFTKPENEDVFKSLAFHLIAKTKQTILLESNPNGIKKYVENLSEKKRPDKSGVIVMNCNPMTLGHRFLIETASKQVDTLHIMLVSEDQSYFSFTDRLQMLKEGTSDLENVIIHEGGKYVISAATFPNYFIKNADCAAKAQMELDLTLFVQYIAPALEADIRFVGTEPYDLLTKQYNELMKALLPQHGISVREIDRLQKGKQFVSATQVRKLLKEFRLQEAFQLVPETNRPYLNTKYAEEIAQLAVNALSDELDTSPKPGLVDKIDSGSHRDMDYSLMKKSIESLYPYFVELAKLGLANQDQEKLVNEIRKIGIEAENKMLEVTGGVNTHRGGLFSIGLSIAAISVLIRDEKKITPKNISNCIKSIASYIPRQSESNGGKVYNRYKIKGALDNAQDGYRDVFEYFLPVYRKQKEKELDNNTIHIRTLLFIMSRLDDTNIYHRKGEEIARQVKEISAGIFEDYNLERVKNLNDYFIKEGISPGGSADMLGLTIFLYRILITQR